MSIINDALKKAQASLEKKSKKKTKKAPSSTLEVPKTVKGSIKKKKAWYQTMVALISLFFFIIGILLTILLILMKESNQKSPTVSKSYVTRIKPVVKRNYAKDELILSGITSIGSKSAAIINDDVYQVGEEVNGFIIEAINLKEVVAIHLESGKKKRVKVK